MADGLAFGVDDITVQGKKIDLCKHFDVRITEKWK